MLPPFSRIRGAVLLARGAVAAACLHPRAAAAHDPSSFDDAQRAVAREGATGPAGSSPEEPTERCEPDDAAAPAPLPQLGAIVPGILLHGSGHWLAGKRRTAYRLLLLEGAGVGMVLAGGASIFLTGASRFVVGPAALLLIGGVGLFGISFLADVYGVMAPEGGLGEPLRVTPWIETQLGAAYVHDPQFAYSGFLTSAVDFRWDHWRLHPSAWFAVDHLNSRARLLGSYRFAGPLPGRAAPDGSFVDGELALTHYRFSPEGFTITTGEVFVNGRLDLRRFDPELAGSFAELGAGLALQGIHYRPEHGGRTDVADLLLARFGYGIYLGDPAAGTDGEVMAFYDHRHDGYAAGLQIPGVVSGVAGHFGLRARAHRGAWGFAVEGRAGSAYVVQAALIHRQLGDGHD